MEAILFYIFAVFAVASALCMITRANPITAALSLVVCFLSTAGIFALLGSVFIAVLQILLYAGAIMVLFIFVIMLIHTDPKELRPRMITLSRVIGSAAALYLAVVLVLALWRPPFTQAPSTGASFLAPATLGKGLLTTYLVPFEVLSVLLLVAIVGAVVLAKKEL